MLGWLFLGGLVSLERMGLGAPPEEDLAKGALLEEQPGAVMDVRG
jgi:hypothetical protein